MQKQTQNDLVIDYIKQFGSITPLDALKDLGVMRLASRISDLKKKGYPIVSKQEAVATRYGTKTKVARYSLGGEE